MSAAIIDCRLTCEITVQFLANYDGRHDHFGMMVDNHKIGVKGWHLANLAQLVYDCVQVYRKARLMCTITVAAGTESTTTAPLQYLIYRDVREFGGVNISQFILKLAHNF